MLSRVATSRIHRICTQSRRLIHDNATREGWLFVDSVFPVQLGVWDVRHYIGLLRQESLLAALKSRLSEVQAHKFTVLELEPHMKDGGVFVRFQYSLTSDESSDHGQSTKPSSENSSAIDSTASAETTPEGHTLQEKRVLHELEELLNEAAEKPRGIPSWLGLGRGKVWLVKGSPWREDMNRFAFPILRVSFEGPDIPEQILYELFRPYGRIQDLALPTPVPAGTLRSSTITFTRLRSATIARNVVHGLEVASEPSNVAKASLTRLRTAYQKPIRAHAVRDWIASHPKIVLPVLVFLFGSITYTIFNPVRSLMIQSKMLNWFDYRESRLYQWIRSNTYDRLPAQLSSISSDSSASSPSSPSASTMDPRSSSADEEIEGVWKERQEAERAVRTYLSDSPSTVAFLHGPQGSGKSRLLETVLGESGRNIMYIDCRELQKAGSDPQLVGALAKQTGYWPVFTFFDSMSSLLDLASVGLIGQKAGFSSSLPDQLNQVLSVVTRALQAVSASHVRAKDLERVRAAQAERRKAEESVRREKIKRGTWHDGRLDCIAGNGVISELGVGDEGMGVFEEEPEARSPGTPTASYSASEMSEAEVMRDAMLKLGKAEGRVEAKREKEKADKEVGPRKQPAIADAQALAALPVVVIRNYTTASKASGSKEDLLTVLAQWAAGLAENQIAHVIVVSDNRENAKRLAKAIPSKPLNSIALSDADTASALSFVKRKLRDADIDVNFTQKETEFVERLGGRASDLESLIHKVRNGQGVEEAVEDIIARGISELRKSAFGDDVEDAKGLAWSREQAWAVLKQLAKKPEVSYHEVLIDFPFKGDESPLRSMEHAELIAIGTVNGRPSTIRPGKPVYKYVFERLVKDPIFQASQDIAFNDKLIASAEGTIKTCEEELRTLESIREQEARTRGWLDWAFGWVWGARACDARAAYLFDKIGAAERKLEGLERRNAELKKLLGGRG